MKKEKQAKQEFKSLKEETLSLMPPEDRARYQAIYDRVKAQVRNANRLAGTNASAAQVLRNIYKYGSKAEKPSPSDFEKFALSLPVSRLQVEDGKVYRQRAKIGKERQAISAKSAINYRGGAFSYLWSTWGQPLDEDAEEYGDGLLGHSERLSRAVREMIAGGATPDQVNAFLVGEAKSNREKRRAGNYSAVTGSDL